MTDLEKKFRTMGVRELKPGFYDDPAFLAAERTQPLLLESYAEYINSLHHSPEYLDRARTVITSAASFLSTWLEKDGRKGACIDASGILGRFLEKEGIWNYVVKGGLTIEFETGLGLPTTYLAPVFDRHIPAGLAATGHAWLVAPPFKIIDITLRQQPYGSGQEKHLPDTLFVETVQPAERTVYDWIDPDLLRKLVQAKGRMVTLADLPKLIGAQAVASAHKLGAYSVKIPTATLKYAGTGILAGDAPLEKAANLVLCGVKPFALYQKWCAER